MTKRIFISAGVIVALVAVAGFFLYRWFYSPVTADISSDISNQTKARIEQLKAEGSISGTLRTVKNEKGEVFTTSCFSTIIPLPFGNVRDQEESNKCLIRAQLVDPRGTFVVHSEYQPSLSSITETSGVMMRLQSEDYTEIKIQTNKLDTLAFQSNTEVTVFVYEKPLLISISFSELGAVDEEIITAAQEAVNALEVFGLEPLE